MARKVEVLKPPATISEAIYQYLKKAIVEGEYKPNQRLQEKEIAKLFSVSPTPVREAFLRLSAEKYLQFNVRREVVVKSRNLEEVKELHEVLRTLDKLAVVKALKNLTRNDVETLKKMTQKLGEYYKKNNIQKYLAQNLKFHEQIWQKCGNKSLYEILCELSEKIAIYRRHKDFSPFSIPYSIDKSYSDHQKIMEAIEKKDECRLEEIISTHWGEDFFIENK